MFLSLVSCFLNAQSIAINEVMGSNQVTITDYQGDYEDWIELYNYGSTPVNLQGFGLSDDIANPFKWVFPNTLLGPNSFLLVWASGKHVVGTANELHTNFSVSSSGESVTLTAPDGTTLSQAPILPFQIDVSIGRQPDGTGSWLYFYSATPNASNVGTGITELVVPPIFSQASGLYSTSFSLNLSHPNPNAIIVYTLDGSDPSLSNLSGSSFSYKNVYPLEIGSAFGPLLSQGYVSNTYTQPIQIIDRSPLPDQLTKKNTSQTPHHIPPNPVRKGTVVKARAYVNGIASPIIGQTYFVWPQGSPYSMPVISIIIPEKSMFDYNDGIYTAGVDFDTWRTNNPNNNQFWRPEWNNYWRSGDLWEYPMHYEVFSPDNFNTLLSQRAGMRIHGNNSRVLHIKNLRLYARGVYDGNSTFDLPVFTSTIPFAVNPNNTISKRILLRADGAGGPVVYDVAFNRLMQPVYEGVTRIEHAIHFINGEYWGLTAFRDRFDAHHYSNNFGVSDTNIVQIDCKGSNCALDEGTNTDFDEFIVLRDYVIQNDMGIQSNFDQVEAQLDMRSFIDHMVLQLFSADNSYERFFWKTRVPENNNFGDGKWRLATQDFEASLSLNNNWLVHWTNIATLSSNSQWFARLLANTSFRNRFINRYADLLNTAFLSTRFTEVIENIYEEVTPYLAEDIQRMPREVFYQQSEKNSLLAWANERPNSERTNVLTHFQLNALVTVTVDVDAPSAGRIQVNTVLIDPETTGVSQNPYPWTGTYFNGVPIQLVAIPNPGFQFSHWSGSVDSTNDTLVMNPEGVVNLTAHFTQITDFQSTTYFWFMGTAIPNDVPLTSLAATYSINQTPANLIFQSCLSGYPFSNTHPQWRKASMERRNLPTNINYRVAANNNIAFQDSDMRAIQIKQPFQNGGMENTLILEFSTLQMEQIQLSMAAETDGAAEFLVFDYWDGQAWVSTGLSQTQFGIASGYQLITLDFSSVPEANDQSLFKVRIRFAGNNMTVDEGKRVHLNNIAIDAVFLGLGIPSLVKEPQIVVYPNPSKGQLTVRSDFEMDELVVFDVLGRTVYQTTVGEKSAIYNFEALESGVYWIQIRLGEKSTTVRFIKE